MTIAIVKLSAKPAVNLLVLVLLLALSWIDLRSRYVPPAAVLAICLLSLPGVAFADVAFALGVYVLLRLLSALTKWSLGGGDIKLLAALALYLRIEQFSLFLLPLGVGCLGAIFWAVIQKIPKERQIPFVPFISSAFSLWLLLQLPVVAGG